MCPVLASARLARCGFGSTHVDNVLVSSLEFSVLRSCFLLASVLYSLGLRAIMLRGLVVVDE